MAKTRRRLNPWCRGIRGITKQMKENLLLRSKSLVSWSKRNHFKKVMAYSNLSKSLVSWNKRDLK